MQKHEAGAPGQLASGRSALVHAAIRLDPMGARPPGARMFLSTGVRGHTALPCCCCVGSAVPVAARMNCVDGLRGLVAFEQAPWASGHGWNRHRLRWTSRSCCRLSFTARPGRSHLKSCKMVFLICRKRNPRIL